jgi:hypothetical protein
MQFTAAERFFRRPVFVRRDRTQKALDSRPRPLRLPVHLLGRGGVILRSDLMVPARPDQRNPCVSRCARPRDAVGPRQRGQLLNGVSELALPIPGCVRFADRKMELRTPQKRRPRRSCCRCRQPNKLPVSSRAGLLASTSQTSSVPAILPPFHNSEASACEEFHSLREICRRDAVGLNRCGVLAQVRACNPDGQRNRR